uniref:CSON015062 protein n=1 Tax=Culicoides sonorensis TaxID=179676 RepID=A0A336MI65_CULSO
MDKILIYLISLFSLFSLSTPFDLFPENGKYIYRLDSYVTLVPDLHSQENPQWDMKGVLEVDKVDSQKLILTMGLYGKCPVEHYVVESDDNLKISKTYDMDKCTFVAAIYKIRSNVPLNVCQPNMQEQTVSSRIASYNLKRTTTNKYLLTMIDGMMRTNVQTFEAFYPQFLINSITIKLIGRKTDVSYDASFGSDFIPNSLTFVRPLVEATGGRSAKNSDQLIEKTSKLLIKLAENLETFTNLDFESPYNEKVSELIRLMSTMTLEALQRLYKEIDIGTSYLQETARNLFIEILPRCGTKSTVLFTRDMVVNKMVKSTTAVELLLVLPFNIAEYSTELVIECESFLNLGPDRPDVRQSAILSYSIMIYKTFVAGQMSTDLFDDFCKKYFDLFLNSFDFEEQLLYLQGMANLQLRSIADYLEPIIKGNYSQTTDIRFLSIWATFATSHLRPEKVFETYWPIYKDKTQPLQLRIGAFVMLLVSNPSPGRLLALYDVINTEKDPHMVNFYRTTVLSLSESTYACYRSIQRYLSYMIRSLPKKPLKRYWVSGNYAFDYRDRKFHIGAILQAMMIGDPDTNLPMMGYFKFDTEALGRFTSQLGLYVKARGLTDAVIGRLSKINEKTFKSDKLKGILNSMKLPTVSETPLHLEIVFQVEGKSVLSYYLNQTTFQNLTDGDLINRIQSLIQTDSHINLQNVMRPFMIQYLVPTMIGTPADILIENTIVSSLRGNTTQNMQKLTRQSQIELQYNSYSVTKIRSYNPVQDLEYATIREQSFLIFAPMMNEITFNLQNNSLSFSFYRPPALTTGMSLKSRTRNEPKDSYPIIDLSGKEKIKSLHYFIKDLGVNVSVSIHEDYAHENLEFTLEKDIQANAKILEASSFSPLNRLMDFFGLLQLNSIQIGQNKFFTLLAHNEELTFLDGVIRWDIEDLSTDPKQKEEKIFRFDLSLNHRSDRNDPSAEHRWEFLSKISTFKNSDSKKVIASLSRKQLGGSKWKFCITSTIESFVFLRSPLMISTNIVFGNVTTSKKCPTDKSRIDLDVKIGVSKDVETEFKTIAENSKCPKAIVKFTPPIFNEKCPKELYKNFTKIGHFDGRLRFEQMPKWFLNIANRVDHFLCAFLPGRIERLNLTEGVKFSVNRNKNREEPAHITLNGVSFDFPLNIGLDWKYEGQDKLSASYGFTGVCSLVGSDLNSFRNNFHRLDPNSTKNYTLNDEILITADCSQYPKFAVFVSYQNDDFQMFDYIKVFIGNHQIYIPNNTENDYDDPLIRINDEDEIRLNKTTYYQYPKDEKIYDYRLYINDENILVVDTDLLSAVLQYDLNSILSVKVSIVRKMKMCGLCE